MTRRPEFSGEQFEKGLNMRREVLGDAYVERSVSAATEISAPLQKLITEWCWGEVWTRPNLDKKYRSVLNLGMLMALNRRAELRLHMRGAINNGITTEELVEVVLQGAIYCGAPAALDAMKVLQEVLAEVAEERGA